MRRVKKLLNLVAGAAKAHGVGQHKVVISAAGHEAYAALGQGIGQNGGVFHDLTLIRLKLLAHRFLEADGLAGDIWVSGEDAVIFLMQSVERHVADGLDKVGRCGVKVSPVPLGELKAPERKVKHISFSVKSMRFDAVLAGIFGLSRTAAASHIAEGAASLNYSVCIKNDAAISPGDVISLRGYGKAAVSASGGMSRKGRLFVEAEIYK